MLRSGHSGPPRRPAGAQRRRGGTSDNEEVSEVLIACWPCTPCPRAARLLPELCTARVYGLPTRCHGVWWSGEMKWLVIMPTCLNTYVPHWPAQGGEVEEDEEEEWRLKPCEVCGRRYPHEHVRAVYGSSAAAQGQGGSDDDDG